MGRDLFAAYRLRNLLEKHRIMMADWANYIEGRKQQ